MTRQLQTLIELRGRALDKRQSEFAASQALAARLQRTVERLELLDASVATAGQLCAATVANTHAYKQGLQAMADQQRQALLRQQSAVGEAHAAVQKAAREQEVISQLKQRLDLRAEIARARLAQKGQDELATQSWLRGPAL